MEQKKRKRPSSLYAVNPTKDFRSLDNETRPRLELSQWWMAAGRPDGRQGAVTAKTLTDCRDGRWFAWNHKVLSLLTPALEVLDSSYYFLPLTGSACRRREIFRNCWKCFRSSQGFWISCDSGVPCTSGGNPLTFSQWSECRGWRAKKHKTKCLIHQKERPP